MSAGSIDTEVTDAAGTGRAAFNRVPALDGVRGAAIAMVLVGHTYGLLPGLAAAGVGLFFVLSGFLITTILLTERQRKGRISLGRFYARRALRLLPALAVLLTTSAVYILFLTDGATRAHGIRSLWSSAAYLSNWLQALGRPYEPSLGHTWSLATEEQFYLFWPLLLVGLCALKRREKIVVPALLVLIVGAAGLRAFLHVHPSSIRGGLYFSPITWADSLLIGCLFGVAYSWRLRTPRSSGPVLAAAIAFLVVAIASGSGDLMFSGGATAMGLAFAVIIWAALAPGRVGPVFAHPALRWLGGISYGAYLWQGPIVWNVMHHWNGIPVAVKGTAAIAGSLIAAWLSFRFVEAPFLRLKERMGSGRSARKSRLAHTGGSTRGAGALVEPMNSR